MVSRIKPDHKPITDGECNILMELNIDVILGD